MLDFLTFTHKVGVPSIVLTVDENPDVKRVADHILHLEGELERAGHTARLYHSLLFIQLSNGGQARVSIQVNGVSPGFFR